MDVIIGWVPRRAVLATVLAGILLWSMIGATTGEAEMVDQSTYPVEHAGPARRCAVGVRFAGTGKVGWSRQVASEGTDNTVTGLILWNDHPIVTTASSVRVFTPDGTALWERARQPSSPVAVGNGLLYCENRNCKLDAVNLRNEPELDNVPFPVAMNAEFRVQLLWPLKDALLAAAFWPGREPEQKPDILWARTVYGHRIGEQGASIRQWLHLPPLYVPEQDRLYLCAGDTIECIGVGKGDKIASFAIPVEKTVEWQAGADGRLCLNGYEGERKVLAVLSPAGAVTERWVDSGGSDRWVEGQPPVQGGKGRIFVLTDKRLLAFNDGKPAWQFESKDGRPKRATSLADGSILITAGAKLLHLDADGKMGVSVALEGEIVTSPVVDAAGQVYVATKSHLVQIR